MMLARAARRKLRRDAFRSTTQLGEQLTLPWQRPGQIRWTSGVGSSTTTTHDARRPRPGALSPRHETRSLATQADAQQSHIPFDGLIQPWNSRGTQSSLSRLDPWNPATPLIMRELGETPTTPLKYGIGGDPIELFQNLHACLRVGRMDRATAIIHRLTLMYSPTASEVVEAHNAYLQTMFDLAQQNPEAYTMAAIEEWYDSNMVRKAIEPNANTFITLLRASMTLLEGSERQRSLRKYLTIAEECCGSDVMDTINYSEDFDDQEWDALIRAQPERFKEPAPLDQLSATAQQYDISTPLGAQALIDHGIIANPAHTVKEVVQKGEGLVALKGALATFDEASRVPYPHDMEGSKEDKDRIYAYMRQLQLERDAMDSALNRWKVEDEKLQKIGVHGVLKTKPMQALMWQWYSALLPRMKKEIARTQAVLSAPGPENMKDERHIYGPYLEICKPEKLAAIAVSRVLQSMAVGRRAESSLLKVSILSNAIAEDLRTEIHQEEWAKFLTQRKKARKQARRAMLDSLSIQSQDDRPVQEQPPRKFESPPDNFWQRDMPATIKTRIGALLIGHFLQAATITVTAEDPKTGKTLTSTQAAFHHSIGYANGRRTGWIVPHEEITQKLCNEPTVNTVHSVQLPMVFEPKPWTGFEDGGYYTSSHGVVRLKNGDHSQRAYAESAIANGDMEKMLKGLDVLSKIPWKINQEVFEVMVQAWNSGEGIGAMVAENNDLEPPKEPSMDASDHERREWANAMKQYEAVRSGLHSQRSFQNYQLETARAYVNEPRIYFPHSVDFRGRSYPISPVLNHMGSDFSRCLLRFANGKELGAVGLQWLKVHLANLYGYDKASLREREQFCMDNIDEIYDSAKNPLGGRRWWTKAEDPWQCLACCKELMNALESPDPTRFVSHLPVHQDGTCNGLQHYAALGGDHAGASQVNLEPSDRPQDIYTGVADLVRDMVIKDAENGKKLGTMLKDRITRKVVKRTVMTNVYGVTFMGAKIQVEDELRANWQKDGPGTEVWHAAAYVASKIFEALGQIFNGAQEIQYWLGECAERILTSLAPDQIKAIQDQTEGTQLNYDSKYRTSKKVSNALEKKLMKESETYRSPVIWTTPLKMPVVQPYRKSGAVSVKTKLQEIRVLKNKSNAPVDKRKQLQAFPPNFIHSLDATHMILSALKCDEMGVDFAAVHDSFWTHAADIPNMNVILRDAFVRMHSEDIMGRLRAEFTARYAGSMYKAQIKRGSAVCKKIQAWRVQQHLHDLADNKKTAKMGSSQGRDASMTELALEAKRQELLNSEDPKEKEEGLKMVTPTSIWLANQDPTSLASYRLALLGETKNTGGRNFDEAKDKILTAEAEEVTEQLEADGQEPKDITDKEVAAAEAGIEEEEAAAAEEAEDAEEAEEAAGVPLEGVATPKRKRKNVRVNTVSVWLPLTFPPVPQKGGWDVSRLRESKYFFS